jgi:hypothetical protein
MRMEDSYPAKKVLCTKPVGNGDRRRGRPKLRWCDELHDDPQDGAEIGELKTVKRGVAESHCGHVAPRDVVTLEEEILYNMTKNTVGLNRIGFGDGMVHSGILSFCTIPIVQYPMVIK